MPRRRYRLFMVCAVVIVFMLYRVTRNSDWDPSAYTSLAPKFPYRDTPAQRTLKDEKVGTKRPAQPATAEGKPKPETNAESKDSKPDSKPEPKPLPPAVEDLPKPPIPRPSPDAASPPPPHRPPPPKEDGGKLPQLKEDAGAPGAFGFSPPPTPEGYKAADGAAPERTPGWVKIEDVHWQNPPAKVHQDVTPASTTSSVQIHWTRVPEHFSLREEEIITLPIGKPKPLPSIQFNFQPEGEAARNKRLRRQSQIRSEMKRAWGGYRKYAWMHDELRPVSKSNRDPFCGWAASLVDALDTLWIMGLREEFDEAAHAVKDIDFTYSIVRQDIPVFETIIRYLGGLIAAYDVSGGHSGKYQMLLDKAIELAEILMGTFDTPNRMPILYYRWAPEYASQPHRAITVSVAELGSASMEFTRLAQLTGRQKYYDAVARVTNAFEDLQNRGTKLPGLFPEQIDASGCNRTALTALREERTKMIAEQKAMQEKYAKEAQEFWENAQKNFQTPQGYQPTDSRDSAADAKPVSPPPPAPAAAPPVGASPGADPEREREHQPRNASEPEDGTKTIARRAIYGRAEAGGVQEAIAKAWADAAKGRSGYGEVKSRSMWGPFGADGDDLEWECPKQGLEPGGWGYESFSMGGSQDSTYEYFPKQYILLGGLVSQYKSMHLKVVEAVKKHLLYRPMVKDERDILFSAKASTQGITDPRSGGFVFTKDYEVTHLTCFLGGMFGLGARVFDRPEDLEVAKKLADGCVWAYESMPSGMMPEAATVVPCATTQSCPWNESVWWAHLDPLGETRGRQIKMWEEEQAVLVQRKKEAEEAEEERARRVSVLQAEADGRWKEEQAERERERKAKEKAKPYPRPEPGSTASGAKGLAPPAYVRGRATGIRPAKLQARGPPPPASAWMDGANGETNAKLAGSLDLNAPAEPKDGSEPLGGNATLRTSSGGPASGSGPGAKPQHPSPEAAAVAKAAGAFAEPEPPEIKMYAPPPEPDPPRGSRPEDTMRPMGGYIGQVTLLDEASRPQTHEQFVKARIKNERLPPGFVAIPFRRYILRPEAIESVWYMYRITGDPVWMEKGWRMWESVIKAVRTEVGHSAVDDILDETPAQSDEMESFWFAETLKYFYLLFAGTDTISLDEWVLNTEAHPFRRPTDDVGGAKREAYKASSDPKPT